MKRLVIIIALVALLVGSMIGGMVWAAAPTGKPLVMETGSGKSNTTGNLLIHSYPEVRHVSLTVYNESNGDVDVTVKIGGSDGESAVRSSDYHQRDDARLSVRPENETSV